MKKGILSVLMLLAGTVVFAQRPSLPVTSAEFAPGTVRRQARAEERAERNARFIARQDSLVQSRNFQFLPVSVLEVPAEASRRSTTSTTTSPFSPTISRCTCLR